MTTDTPTSPGHPPLTVAAAATRAQLGARVQSLTAAQFAFAPAPTEWSIAQVLEHVVTVERRSLEGVWQAVAAVQAGHMPISDGAHANAGRTFRAIAAADPAASKRADNPMAPQGTLPPAYWLAALHAGQILLDSLAVQVTAAAMPLTGLVLPHPLFGSLDLGQWFEFWQVHLALHDEQIAAAMQHAAYPSA